MTAPAPGWSTRLAVAAAGLVVMASVAVAAGPPAQIVRVPGIGQVTAYAPAGPPQQVVLFLSGDGGWNLGVVAMAERLRDEGALVVGIDIRAFIKSLEASRSCAYPTGNLEELSRFIQQRMKMPAYKRPLVVGYSSGATMAYAALAAAPRDTLAGVVSLGFCPDLEIRVPLCHMRGLKATRRLKGVGYDLAPFADSTIPWMVLQGEQDQVCSPPQTAAFVRATGAARLFPLPKVGHGFGVPANWMPAYLEAYHAIAKADAATETPRATTPAVVDLSLVEVPASGTRHADTMAIVLSGDGGWAELDKALAQGLAADGIPVVGWSSLDYYWTPRTPDQAAADLARIIRHYSTTWRRPRVVLAGYSFGADVAPFLVNRLPDDVRRQVATLALLAPSDEASFEFHVAEWLGAPGGATHATRPERDRLAVPTVCVSPADEPPSACATENPRVRRVSAGPGHHFGGDYEKLVELIVSAPPARYDPPAPRADARPPLNTTNAARPSVVTRSPVALMDAAATPARGT